MHYLADMFGNRSSVIQTYLIIEIKCIDIFITQDGDGIIIVDIE